MGEGTGWTLEDLRDNWDMFYMITEDYGGLIRVERRDDGALVFADTPDRARLLIIADFWARPVQVRSARE